MSVRRLQIGDEAGFLATGGQIDDGADSWWAGAQRCFAGIALATALAASTFAADLAIQVQRDPEELPAGSLKNFSTPDEDNWQNPVAPVPLSIYQKLPYLPDLSDDPAGSLHGQPEEDFWDNAVNPVPGSVYQRLPYLADPTDDSAGSLHGEPDEDFWVDPVAPVPLTIYQRLPYLPELSDDPAGNLAVFSTPDEDFWDNPVNPVPGTIYQNLPYLPDPEEIPAGTLWAVLEEFYWQNPVAPAPAAIFQRLPYLPDPEEVPAGSLIKFTSPDEDYWQNPQITQIAQIPPSLYQPLPVASGETAEILSQVVFTPDEDFWANPVAPIPLMVYQRLPYLPELSDDPAGSLTKLVSPDEDYWQNPQITQIPASIYQPLPVVAGEPAEIVPVVVFQPDEDYWQNPAFPPGSVWYPVPVAAALFQRFPYLPDPTDDPAGSLRGVPEEAEWPNWVAPVPATRRGGFQLLPYASGEAAEILPSTISDEDCWQNPIIPAPAAQGWVQPVICGFGDFSSYWWSLTWGVCTHSAARGRVSHSAARERISRSAVRPRTTRGVSRQSTWL